MTLQARIASIVARALGVSPRTLADAASPASLVEWDSIQHMHVCLALEEEFALRFDDDELSRIDGPETILEVLRGRGLEASSR
jgi:acyl carrier protein